MPIDVASQTTINRKREDVWKYDRIRPPMATGIKRAKVISPTPFGKGSKIERIAGFLGKRIVYVMEIQVDAVILPSHLRRQGVVDEC